MNAEGLLPVPIDTLLELITHLRNTASTLTPADAAAEAIRAWLGADANAGDASQTCRSSGAIRSDRTVLQATAAATAIGYQWKELFLPDGTDLRMSFDGEVYHARVTGDAIVYQGRRMSPRQLTIAIAGDGRNAWRDLSLRLPGEKNWRPASLLRRNVQANIKARPGGGAQASPAAVIAAAASSMSEALRTALALVEHSNAQSVGKYERRAGSYRRAADVLGEQALLD